MNQSGIRVGEALSKKVSDLSRDISVLKISIVSETLEASGEQAVGSSFETDFDSIKDLVRDDEAAYFLVRESNDPPQYVFVSYVPETARVKDKMTYASTRNTLTRELGTSKFSRTYFATTKDELSYKAYASHQASAEEGAPLSEKEKDIKNIKDAEGEAHTTTSKRAIVSSGIAFPISDEAQEALNVLKTASISRMVILGIDMTSETINLVKDEEIELDGLASHIPDGKPQYLFFAYVHEYEGAGITSQCFIYTCPSSSKVKERMLYSSNRQSIISAAPFTIDVKLECEELDIADLKQRIHPPKVAISSGFTRPKRPGKR